jgi:hypothetical protein
MSANSRNSARVVLESSDISRALSRIAHEILENNKGSKDLVLLGIPSRGVPLANRIAQKINEFEKVNVPVGSLDITMYRDDLRLRPPRALAHTEIPEGGIDHKIVILVDDVLSGTMYDGAYQAYTEFCEKNGHLPCPPFKVICILSCPPRSMLRLGVIFASIYIKSMRNLMRNGCTYPPVIPT